MALEAESEVDEAEAEEAEEELVTTFVVLLSSAALACFFEGETTALLLD